MPGLHACCSFRDQVMPWAQSIPPWLTGGFLMRRCGHS